MWIEWLEASLIILCMYFAYRGCYQDYITYTSEIPSRKNKRVTFKTKNDTKDEEDAGTSPSDNSIVNNSSNSSDTSTTKDAGVPPSYNSIVNTL